MRSSSQSSADAGTINTGRIRPHVNGTETRVDAMSLGV